VSSSNCTLSGTSYRLTDECQVNRFSTVATSSIITRGRKLRASSCVYLLSYTAERKSVNKRFFRSLCGLEFGPVVEGESGEVTQWKRMIILAFKIEIGVGDRNLGKGDIKESVYYIAR